MCLQPDQDLIGDASGGRGNIGGSATSTLIGTNPFGASNYTLQASAAGGDGSQEVGGAVAKADASSSNGGTTNTLASAESGRSTNPAVALSKPASATATSTAILEANASSIAQTFNNNVAQAKSTATGSSGQAQAEAFTNFGIAQDLTSLAIQTASTSPLNGNRTTASAIAQAGGVVSPSNPIIPGQSFSVVSGSNFGPLTVAKWFHGRARAMAARARRSPIRKALSSPHAHSMAVLLCLTWFPTTRSERASTVRYLQSL